VPDEESPEEEAPDGEALGDDSANEMSAEGELAGGTSPEEEPRAASQPSPVADAFEPALNILAYLIARYPDTPQSERALSLAIALVERHNMLPPPIVEDESMSTPSEAQRELERESAMSDSMSPDAAVERRSQERERNDDRPDVRTPDAKNSGARSEPAEENDAEVGQQERETQASESAESGDIYDD
jgi:hypothetical protein